MLIETLGNLGMIAFLVTIIVQMTKELYPIKKMPTNLYVIIISLFVSFGVLVIEESVLSASVVVSTVLSAFPISYVAMNGYDNFKDLYKRFTEGKNNEGIN